MGFNGAQPGQRVQWPGYNSLFKCPLGSILEHTMQTTPITNRPSTMLKGRVGFGYPPFDAARDPHKQRTFLLAELVDSDAIVENQARSRRDRRDWCNVSGRVRREFQEVEVVKNIDISSAIQSETSD